MTVNNIENINVVVIGTGMYAVGRGTSGFGTILPSIVEWKRDGNPLGDVVFVATNKDSADKAISKANILSRNSGISINVDAYPKNNECDLEAYKKVIASIRKPACVIIAVPDHLHYTITKECLLADLHVLVVKPLTPTVEEGRELVKLACKKDLYAAVEFHKRFDKSNLMMRDIVQSNQLGELLYCCVEYSQRKSIPTEVFKQWTEKTSVLQYLGIHYVDVVRFVTGATPVRVMAIGQKTWLPSKDFNAYDSIQCVIEWRQSNGVCFTQTLLTNWIDPENSTAMSDQKIKIVGSKGRYDADQKKRGITINTDDLGVFEPNPDFCMEYTNSYGEKEWKGYGIDSVKTFLSDVVNIQSGHVKLSDLEYHRSTFKESLVSTAVIEAAHISMNDNSNWKEIKEITYHD
jgi:predicted dehydrogenase